MGRSGHSLLDRLIDEVARGERDLSSIRDPRMRLSIRHALRLHDDAPSVPDAYTKARMRARVMAALDPRARTLRDTAWTILEFFARPAPYIVRGVALGCAMFCLTLVSFAASADTIPDDALYPLKLASEQMRLALAQESADRAAVELSIAEHRLVEAEKLAATGRTSDALVASAFYSQHVATAAAELGPDSTAELSTQLESRFGAQRERASVLAATLSLDVKSARAAEVLSMIASSPLATGETRVERVAESAVTLAADLADAAESASQTYDDVARATEAPRAVTTDRGATDRASATASTTRTNTADATTRVQTVRPTLRPATTPDPRASVAAKATREAAEKARAAAEKLKNALKQKGNSGRR